MWWARPSLNVSWSLVKTSEGKKTKRKQAEDEDEHQDKDFEQESEEDGEQAEN